jgi:hypothetical protein
MINKKHTIVIDYNDTSAASTVALMIAELMFVPYVRGKKYEGVEEVNAKIPLMERLFGDDYIYVMNAYLLDVLNPNIRGFSELIQNVAEELKKGHGTKYEIEFKVKKLN